MAKKKKTKRKQSAYTKLVIKLRVPNDLLDLITRAAEIEGKTPVAFVLDAVVDEARIVTGMAMIKESPNVNTATKRNA